MSRGEGEIGSWEDCVPWEGFFLLTTKLFIPCTPSYFKQTQNRIYSLSYLLHQNVRNMKRTRKFSFRKKWHVSGGTKVLLTSGHHVKHLAPTNT
jgi:hypothetical protein